MSVSQSPVGECCPRLLHLRLLSGSCSSAFGLEDWDLLTGVVGYLCLLAVTVASALCILKLIGYINVKDDVPLRNLPLS